MRKGLGALAATAIVGCSAFGTATAERDAGSVVADAGRVDAAVEGGREPPPTLRPQLPPLTAHCPRPPPSVRCAPDACTKVTIHEPIGTELPFGMVTDADSIYWLAQPTADDFSAGYSGKAAARLRRARKAENATAVTMVLGQPSATVLVLDDTWVYWTTFELTVDGTATGLRRVARDCDTCVPETLAMLPGYPRIVGLQRVRAGVLVLLGEGGQVYRVDVRAPKTWAFLTTMGDLPGLAVADDLAFAGGSNTADSIDRLVFTGPSSVVVPFGMLPAPPKGQLLLATDCASLFAFRGGALMQSGPIANDASAFTAAAELAGIPSGSDMTADGRFVYIASADMGGVFAVDITTSALLTIELGNVFNVAVDEQGVYWGDHAKTSGGAIRMMIK